MPLSKNTAIAFSMMAELIKQLGGTVPEFVEQELAAAQKPLAEAKAEAAAKKVNEAISPLDLEALKEFQAGALEVEKQSAAILTRINERKAQMDALRAANETDRDEMNKLEESASTTKASLILMDVAKRVMPEEYTKYAWKFSGKLEAPAQARVPKAAKPAPKPGEPATTGNGVRGKHFYTATFPTVLDAEGKVKREGRTVKGLTYGTLFKLPEMQEYDSASGLGVKWENISNGRSLRGAAGGDALRDFAAGKDFNSTGVNAYPNGRELKSPDGTVYAVITHE